MNDYTLGAERITELRAAHRQTRDKREADRIKAVVLLGTGWSAEQVAEVLQVDPNTVRNHFKRYQQGGVKALGDVAFRGSACALDEGQLAELDAHLQTHLYQTAKAIAAWVKTTFGVSYTGSGMTALLHRLGYVYKKPRLVPGKADPKAQRAFLEQYEKLKQYKGQDDPIYFMDAAHPQHNPVIACGWIKRGEEHEVPTNTGRQRVNINGAIDLERLEPVVRFDDTINADSTIALFEQLERVNLVATWIYVICDNAPYYRSRVVQEYLKTSRIKLVFLPPYAPNLNLIERLWKFFKKEILYNRYFETFAEFKAACAAFFANPGRYHRELRSLLTENFEIVGE
ncbi:transposase [Thioflavicoccus mobilis 8321]|uniref:Transposase n=1 Tax=Thioflavicoccus mobilis 8321 TaxID=765912 RepID=L0GX48_9GAMM|nr:IS630 family transposase [Thioflavicoccus mobilis]AGA90273.1 transposase [Thioflavicoccus mobilis 8321]AGA90900.1 transposase [Thioflavicoccus mobilis 8321]AGA91343.1 transposase [Thioflavicoccus mobilis 8321]AGA92022.1 transposase [Thioflavicoccus mobilis 8321]